MKFKDERVEGIVKEVLTKFVLDTDFDTTFDAAHASTETCVRSALRQFGEEMAQRKCIWCCDKPPAVEPAKRIDDGLYVHHVKAPDAVNRNVYCRASDIRTALEETDE